MRLKIIAVGRLKSGPERELVETYRTRLENALAGLGPLSIIEIDERKDTKHIARALADAMEALPKASRRIALDETGKSLTTKGFAELLTAWRDAGVPEAAFIIGGADGLSDGARKSADLVLSLGKLTWPHRLARAMIAEQLYRAASLSAGHPYHRE
ncbi:MAG: 23S rRNA (pseudouridine(1915)-N(3))-methyltransferase RlmH [Alphaproteobacteria bacterium]